MALSGFPVELLPAGLASAVERETSARIVAVRTRGGGGASREGAELDLAFRDGRSVRAYMNFDVLRAGAGDDAGFGREAAILRALSGPLADSGVRVARFIAALPIQRALLGEFVAGEANFGKLPEGDERSSVARDLMDQLARLHRIDAAARPIEGMGALEPLQSLIERRLGELRQRNTGPAFDPLIHLSLNWLDANVPADLPAPVIVHGDAGPGNFLYANGKLTALLDWELAHYGDPMADIAMLCLRTLFQSFVSLPEAMAYYREAGGKEKSLPRIRYWRLLFQTGFARRHRFDDPAAPPPPNLGMNLVYSAIHRRVLSEALADAAGVTLEPLTLPQVPPGPRARSFALALDDLRETIVPRIEDQQAAVKAKGLARLIKWWRDSERYEPALLHAELTEIEGLLGGGFPDHARAWEAFGVAARDGSIADEVAIRICHRHVTREALLMGGAMGSLANTSFAPLD